MATGCWRATSPENTLTGRLPDGAPPPRALGRCSAPGRATGVERTLQKEWYALAAILIVEEDGVLARQMVRTLRQAGHLPTLASTAQAALREAGEQPDVIVLDLELLMCEERNCWPA